MTKQNETAAVVITAAQKARHNRAFNAAEKAEGKYKATVTELAKEVFPEGVTVGGFAKAFGVDVSMGKKATISRAEANRRRSNISYGLEKAGLLKVNKRAAQSQGQRRKAEAAAAGTEAAEAAQGVKEAVKATANPKPTQAKLFSNIVGMLDDASPATLRRLANELSQRIAAKAKEA